MFYARKAAAGEREAPKPKRQPPAMRADPPGQYRRTPSGRLTRLIDLLVTLTHADLRARYGRGPWQPVKWLLDPLAALGIYLLLVSFVLDRSHRALGLSLACAVIPFQLVVTSVVSAMNVGEERQSIILNMGFERVWLPMSAVLTEVVVFGPTLGLLALMMAIYGVLPT